VAERTKRADVNRSIDLREAVRLQTKVGLAVESVCITHKGVACNYI